MTRLEKIRDMREKIIAFIQGKKNVEKSEIRKHLGLDDWTYNQLLEDALVSRRIRVTKVHPQIGKLSDGSPMYLATPIRVFSPA